MITFYPLSSNVEFIEYNEIDKRLMVSIRGGGVYAFKDVPFRIFDGLRKAKSVGAYLNREVRDVYVYETFDRRIK